MLKALIAFALLSVAAAFAAPGTAQASCAAPWIQTGTYVNEDPNTRSITRMHLEFVCGARHSSGPGGVGSVAHGGDVHYRVRLWGSCSPRDCDWGTTRGEFGRGNNIFARYDQGFARRTVRIIPMGGNRVGLELRSTYNDGRAPNTYSGVFRLR